MDTIFYTLYDLRMVAQENNDMVLDRYILDAENNAVEEIYGIKVRTKSEIRSGSKERCSPVRLSR